MKKIKYYIILICLAALATNSYACIRTDLEDRSKEEVVQKSLFMAKSKTYFGPVIGTIVIGNYTDTSQGKEFKILRRGSGIAINEDTIITAAHIFPSNDTYNSVRFILDAQFELQEIKDEHNILLSNIFIYPSYNNLKITPTELTYEDNEIFFDLIPLEKLKDLEFEEREKYFINDDIALLKLNKSLSKLLTFPKILSINSRVNETYGVCLGYGTMMYNFQSDAKLVDENQKIFKRHLFTHKVNFYESNITGNIFYGRYESPLKKGLRTFVPNLKMLKTEGVPVKGDSGGPLLIEEDNEYKLAGIISRVSRGKPKNWKGQIVTKIGENSLDNFTQPIFHIFTDIRLYLSTLFNLYESSKIIYENRDIKDIFMNVHFHPLPNKIAYKNVIFSQNKEDIYIHFRDIFHLEKIYNEYPVISKSVGKNIIYVLDKSTKDKEEIRTLGKSIQYLKGIMVYANDSIKLEGFLDLAQPLILPSQCDFSFLNFKKNCKLLTVSQSYNEIIDFIKDINNIEDNLLFLRSEEAKNLLEIRKIDREINPNHYLSLEELCPIFLSSDKELIISSKDYIASASPIIYVAQNYEILKQLLENYPTFEKGILFLYSNQKLNGIFSKSELYLKKGFEINTEGNLLIGEKVTLSEYNLRFNSKESMWNSAIFEGCSIIFSPAGNLYNTNLDLLLENKPISMPLSMYNQLLKYLEIDENVN